MSEPRGSGYAVIDGPAMPRSTGGKRIGWDAVPGAVAAGIGRLLGSAVVAADSQPGGFSEGVAARVRLADGRRAFVKAASTLTAPAAVEFHRAEMAITPRLSDTGMVPRLLAAYDDGVWVALVFEEIPGRLPAEPWRHDELERVLSAVTGLVSALTPAPADLPPLRPPRLGGWPALADGAPAERLRALAPWAADHLDWLVGLEERAPSVTTGRTLLHGDLYPFNVMLTADRVYFVDWPHAWVGASHIDLVTLLSGTALSGFDPQALAERHPLTRDLGPLDIDVVLALHAGFLLRVACTVGAGTDRRMVEMMVALATGSLRWLRSRQ